MVNATPRPFYVWERDLVPIVQEDVWAPGPIWTGAENLAPTRIFFVLSLLSSGLPFSSIVHLYLLCPHVTYSCTTHNTNIHAPGGIQTRNPC
jgi:hypothetical protein